MGEHSSASSARGQRKEADVKRGGDQDHIRWHVVWQAAGHNRGLSLGYPVEAVSQYPIKSSYDRESQLREPSDHFHSRWWRLEGTDLTAGSRADSGGIPEDERIES